MRAKRVWAALLCGAMTVGSLAGCGSSKTSETTTTATDNAGKAETKKVALKVWGPQEDQAAVKGYENGWLKGMCEKFNAAHPEWDITYTYGVCSEGDAYKTVKNDVVAAADVYMFANDQIPDLVKAGALAQLGGKTAEAVKADNEEVIANSVTYEDAVYGVPFTSNTWFLYYDKSKYSEEDVKSLDAMMKKDLGNGVSNFAFSMDNSWYVPAFFFAGGCTLFGDAGNDESKGCDFNNDAGVAVGNYMAELAKNKKFSLEKKGTSIAKFTKGQLGAYCSGSWDAKAIKDALKDNMGVAVLPTINVNGKDGQMKSFAGSKAIGVNPNSKSPEVAVALAAYLGSEEAQQSHYETRGIIPSNKNVAASDAVKKDEIATVQAQVISTTSVVQPLIAQMGNFWSPVESFAKEICQGDAKESNMKQKLDTMVGGIMMKKK